MLQGIKRRCDLLGVPYPVIATVDNCCAVKAALHEVFPDMGVALDVHHHTMR